MSDNSPISDGTMVGIAGAVMVLLALLIGYVSYITKSTSSVIGWFFLLLVVGTVLMYVSSYMTRKEREKALHQR